MKYLKKLASVLLTLVMVMALAAPAFAATTDGTITITNATLGEDYSIYKIFDLESYGEGGVQSYKINAAWTEFFNEAPQSTYVEDLKDGFVNWVGPATDTTELAEFAKSALAWAKTNSVTAVATKVAPEAAGGAETSTVTFDNLELGWYLLDSTVGTLCSLSATTPDATIKEKNVLPTPKKEQDTTEVVKGVGDTITYTVEVEVKAGANNYVLHDTMSEGLTYNDDVTAKIKGTETVVTLEDATLGEGETFAKKIVDVGNYVGQTIVFTYTATINAKAVTVDKVTNTAKISYGENNKTTEESKVEYDLYDLKIFKYTTGENDAEVKLDGAKFELYDVKTGGNKIPLVYVEADAYYRVATAVEQAAPGFESAVIEAGEVTIKGLAAGSYWLEETAAPGGYNKLTERVEAKVETEVENTAKVLNNTGTQLPSTGGIGTTIFYVVGGVLMVGAVVVLIAKRRTGSDEE